MDLGRAAVNQESIGGKLQGGSRVTFHWLSYGHLPLAELSLGKEESFLPPAEVVSLPV